MTLSTRRYAPAIYSMHYGAWYGAWIEPGSCDLTREEARAQSESGMIWERCGGAYQLLRAARQATPPAQAPRDRRALARLVARLERDAVWQGYQWVLPYGAVALGLGNAASVGVQLAHVLAAYPRLFAAARRAAAARE